MFTYSLLRITRSSCKAVGHQVRYRRQPVRKSKFSKLPTINPTPDPFEIEDVPQQASASSEAMKTYLNRVQNYNQSIAEEKIAYEIGKRHLANMMGRDPETFTQDDIDEAIQYLFPCALPEPGARPMMKPPEEIFPPKKEAEFDESGRPYNFLFYTTKPRFYQVLHDASKIMRELNEYEDKVIRGDEINTNYTTIPLNATAWIDLKILLKQFQEFIHEAEYAQLKLVLERIANHPYGSKYTNFVGRYLIPLTEKQDAFESQKPVVLGDGRQRVFFPLIQRRTASVSVSITYPGSGQFLIDGKDVQFFGKIQAREAVLYPLVLSNMIKKVDIDIQAFDIPEHDGSTALAGAMRLGISRGLFHFVDDHTKDKLKLAGLLNEEIRFKERKKPGQEGARRKFTWKKR